MSSAQTRKWLLPEVVQTSTMDCGPAALKCLLEGFGIPVSYGRLREACQTGVDGTSIDTLEEIAQQLGLEAEQVMLPLDHLLGADSGAWPAILVVRLPNGFTHFVVIWRRHGSLVQVMDPSIGRRWVHTSRLLREVYVHTAAVPASGFRDWVSSETFLSAFRQRVAELGCGAACESWITKALADPTWRSLASLDAATRMVSDLVKAKGVTKGDEAARLIASLVERARLDEGVIPSSYWTARPAPSSQDRQHEDEEHVLLRGAVLVRIVGKRARLQSEDAPGPLPPELALALEERPRSPGLELIALLRDGGIAAPLVLLFAVIAAVFGASVEAVLFRGLFEIGKRLELAQQRVAAIGALILFSSAMLALELPIQGGLQRIGRRLEIRLRVAFLEKLPRLADRYFQSRPTSDMADRGHAIHALRTLPVLGGQAIRAALELIVTTAGIVWIDAKSAPLALAVALLAVGLPLVFQPAIVERDLRVRNHQGALSRFYLDSLRGLIAVRSHAAERAVRREHESLLVDWSRASRSLLESAVTSEAVQTCAVQALTIPLVIGYLTRASEPAAVLLLLYWALNLPAVGQELGTLVRQYPAQRNTTLRLLEPLGALEETPSATTDGSHSGSGGVALTFEGTKLVAGGHVILDEVDLAIASGEHVAIVGASGAGKSSFVGALLGWHRASAGRILVDGAPLDAAALREECAWVDPAVELWNRSLLENLRYGSSEDPASFSPVLAVADLRALLATLPDGLQTSLGESGGLVSGGEGQRVRLGRALLRKGARLAILDEPFRGLDRGTRRALLARARTWWKDATLLCVTHDVGETLDFSRVLVLDQGRIVEDGTPSELAADESSRYHAMLDAEKAVREGLWRGAAWRRIRLVRGALEAEITAQSHLVRESEKTS